jgi:NAD(P)-dependent dehydrogenase (short-subunit alcohol dehydrogenase family)
MSETKMQGELFNIKGRTALVTGSSRGIGRAIALTLAEAGANVAIHYAGNAAQAQEVAKTAAAFGVKTTLVQGDLSADAAAASIFEGVVSAFGQLDILVLNASVQIPKDWLSITREDLEKQVAVNFRSSFELLQLAAPGMVERKWGRVLTIGSVQEKKPNPEMAIYSSLKSAQTALGLSLANQFAPHGVTVNNLAPGVIETDRYRERVTTPERAAKVLSWIPAGFIGQAKDCAGAALLLCSDAGRYITGQNLFVDGGMSL